MTTEDIRPAMPPIVDRGTWQAQIAELRKREKAHTREGDAIAAARRRLPMVEVDASDAADRRARAGHRCSTPSRAGHSCTRRTTCGTPATPPPSSARAAPSTPAMCCELGYLHSRDVTFAVFCEGPFEESNRYREFMGWEMPWYSVPEESLDRIAPGGHFGMKACYLRDGDRVFETYWTTGRGCEMMGEQLRDARHDGLRPPGAVGGLARGLAAAVRRATGGQHSARRAADLAVVADRRRPLRRPRHRGHRPHRTPRPLRPPRRSRCPPHSREASAC